MSCYEFTDPKHAIVDGDIDCNNCYWDVTTFSWEIVMEGTNKNFTCLYLVMSVDAGS